MSVSRQGELDANFSMIPQRSQKLYGQPLLMVQFHATTVFPSSRLGFRGQFVLSAVYYPFGVILSI